MVKPQEILLMLIMLFTNLLAMFSSNINHHGIYNAACGYQPLNQLVQNLKQIS